MKITNRHPFTGEYNTRDLNITEEQMDNYRNGELVQKAFPNLSPEDRGFILTGITNWDEVVPHE